MYKVSNSNNNYKSDISDEENAFSMKETNVKIKIKPEYKKEKRREPHKIRINKGWIQSWDVIPKKISEHKKIHL